MSAALMDRLTLTEERIAQIAQGVREIVDLPDPVGETIRSYRRPNGLDIAQVRVPLGVVGIIYEARPNVTVDAAALCLKSGNAALLRGSSDALHSNVAIAAVIQEALVAVGASQGGGAAHRGYRPRRRAGDDAAQRLDRRPHPPGRDRPDPSGGAKRHGARHRDGSGQLPRLRRRGRRS